MTTKRVLAGILWSYCAWYAWSLYAGLAELNLWWGPVIALSVIALGLAAQIGRDWVATADGRAAKGSISPAADQA